MVTRSLAHLLSCALLLLAVAAPTEAKHGPGSHQHESRSSGSCGGRATWELQLRSRDGKVDVEFAVKHRRAHEAWRVVLVHERRVALRITLRTSAGGSLRLRRYVRNYEGPDRVTLRATGPHSAICVAVARLIE